MGNNIYIGRLFAIQEMLNIPVKRDRNVCNYIGIKASNIFISRCVEFLSYSPGPFVSLTLSEHDLKHVCFNFFS